PATTAAGRPGFLGRSLLLRGLSSAVVLSGRLLLQGVDRNEQPLPAFHHRIVTGHLLALGDDPPTGRKRLHSTHSTHGVLLASPRLLRPRPAPAGPGGRPPRRRRPASARPSPSPR